MSVMALIIVYFALLFSFCYPSEIKSHTHHTFDIGQHQVSTCIHLPTTPAGSSNFKNSETTTVLEVYHRRGLCTDGQTHTTTSSSLTAEEILHNDRLRIKSINDKMKTNEEDRVTTKLQNRHTADLPVQSGLLYNGGDYVVPIGLGTPTRKLHLIFDTGSDITWTQCQPCVNHCYKQRDHIFNPLNSTSYHNISCTDPKCPQSSFSCYHRVTCTYSVPYGDQSYTGGFLAKDKLTLARKDVFPNFVWGCGQNNTGNFGETAGLLGLGRGNYSIVSQTAKKYNEFFSYILPKNQSSKGKLTFGRSNNPTKDLKFTPLFFDPYNPYLYFIQISSITVGKRVLDIPPSLFRKDNTIIDSGTVITRLPQKAYIPMRKEFMCQMSKTRYTVAPGSLIFDTCFSVPNDTTNIVVPRISFTFEGNVTVDLDPLGILYVIDSSLVCLAFAGNSDPEDDFTIYGNRQQLNMEVAYDVAGGKLGFGHPVG